MKTIKEYKRAILKKYEEGEIEYLTQLSPARIRQDCLLKFQNGLKRKDLIQFIRFFGIEDESNYLSSIRKIENIDIDKFRPFKNFLNRTTENTFDKNVELIAVLTDFEPRPFSNFRNNELKVSSFGYAKNKQQSKTSTESTFKRKIFKKCQITDHQNSDNKSQFKIPESIFSNKKFFLSLGTFLAIYVLMITAKYLFASKSSPDKQDVRYMIWTGDSYKEAPYHIIKSSDGLSNIALYEESKMLNFKKVDVTPYYPFFTKQNEPNLWYAKNSKNEIEFFSAPGKHPVSGKTLKAITPYIIEKYITAIV